ncbi:hypothetical protein [Ornithinibacillus bavariensis]|uniref:hypothetical protein n=1 Tax=Ornithinibacillus bavariensis TaxID=545502 RepID=UPI000EC18EA8|nr:hypothetical protein [Ornithinibacillus sp.]
MNEDILSRAKAWQEILGLDHYVLERSHIFSETNLNNRTSYILSLELFPTEEASEEHEDFNPTGTASLDIDFHTNKLRRIIFVNGVSFANEHSLPTPEIENVIEWIEEVTDMMFGRQFKLVYEGDREYRFQATVDNMEVAPTGEIEVRFNDTNQLTMFSIDGLFPTEDEVEWEPFSLTRDDITEEIQNHFSFLEAPIEEEEKWLPIWQVNEFYIRNDQSEIILPESILTLDTYHQLNRVIKWDNTSTKEFSLKDLELSTEISYEDAMHKVTVQPISQNELTLALEETKDFLSQFYPNDSGKWTATGMYPEKNYIFVEFEGETFKAFKRKLKVIINREDFTTVNYWDSQFLLDMFNDYKEADQVSVTKEEAFSKIVGTIEVIPVYVKNAKSESYQLCGRVSCNYVVNAATGDLIDKNEL